MCNRLFTLLVVLFLTGTSNADQNLDSENVEVMVERYVSGMGKIAKKMLADSGMAHSDIDRIAVELSASITVCVEEAFAEEASGPVDVEASNDKMESCVHAAFENAGIRYP